MHDEGTKAVINLLDDKKMYVVKEGRLIGKSLPQFGEIKITMHGGKIKHIESSIKEQI